jgi:hypothetical protein
MARTTIHCCAQQKCPARGRNFRLTARREDHVAPGQPVRCPVCGEPSDFIRNETTRLRWLKASGGLVIGVLSVELATQAGVERWPAIAFGVITFAISTLLLGMFDWLKPP